jgi:hypothetical protein
VSTIVRIIFWLMIVCAISLSGYLFLIDQYESSLMISTAAVVAMFINESVYRQGGRK